jgi:ligand-binding sensor domain-containing protein
MLLALSLGGEVRAEKLPFKSYTTAEGLAHDRVNEIVRDSRGFLWFCTGEGLSRFDGYEFKNYTQAHGLPHRSINDLLELEDGSYLVATDDGLTVFNPHGAVNPSKDSNLSPMFRTFRTVEREADRLPFAISDLYKSRNGQIWVTSYKGFYRLVREADQHQQPWRFEEVKQEALHGKEILHIAEDHSGALWMGAEGGLVRYQPETDEIITKIAKAGITSLLADSQGRVWASQNGAPPGLYLYNLPTRDSQPIVTRHFTIEDGLKNNNWINHLIETRDGRILAGMPQGLCEYLPGSEPSFRVLVSSADVVSLAEDNAGNIWIGTASLGALKLARSGFVLYGERDGDPELQINSIIPGDAGEIFATTGKLEMQRFDGKQFSGVKPAGILPRNWGWNQLDFRSRVNGEWWIPTVQGLLRYENVKRIDDLARTKPSKIYTKNNGLFGNAIFRLFEDSRGDVWISMIDFNLTNTLMRWERRSEKFYGYTVEDNLPAVNAPTAFGEDAAGNVWIGYYNGGIARYRNGKFRFYSLQEGFPVGLVNAIHSDQSGRIWIGISNSGLVRVDNPTQDEPRFVNLTIADGLSSNQGACITEDNFGRIYVGTGRGISRIEPNTGRIKIYSKADGLPHSSVRTCGRDALGNLWFTQKFNLIRFTPEPDARTEPPPIYIADVRVNGESAKKFSELGETRIQNLAFDSDGRQIQIDFFALGFSTGERLFYQYKLDGVDSDWSEPTTQRTVHLNLAAGAYRFLVRAVNSEGVASENPALVAFAIARPVWLRWWFVSLAILWQARRFTCSTVTASRKSSNSNVCERASPPTCTMTSARVSRK